ncbi:MAG: hypothetical protein AAF907_06605 [Planctomycetota bacterium]
MTGRSRLAGLAAPAVCLFLAAGCGFTHLEPNRLCRPLGTTCEPFDRKCPPPAAACSRGFACDCFCPKCDPPALSACRGFVCDDYCCKPPPGVCGSGSAATGCDGG